MRSKAKTLLEIAVAVIAAVILGLLAERGLRTAMPGRTLWDFGSFVASGRAAAEGLNPYGIYPLTFHVVLAGFESWNPNLNPPISAILFQAFNWVEPHLGFRIWWGISLACYAATVALLVHHYAPKYPWVWVMGAFALAGVRDTLLLGQIYMPLVLAGVAGWIALEKGSPIVAGILIGLVVAMKPNFLVWPTLLFLAGQRKATLSAVATAMAVSAIPLLVYGGEVYHQWFELVASDSERGVFLTNVSIFGIAARLGVPALGPFLALAILAGLVLWVWRRGPSLQRVNAAGIVGALLASPVAWIHYTLFLLPLFFASRRSWPVLVVAAMVTIPVPRVLRLLNSDPWVQATAGSIYGWAMVLCLAILLFLNASEDRSAAGGAVRPLKRLKEIWIGRLGYKTKEM